MSSINLGSVFDYDNPSPSGILPFAILYPLADYKAGTETLDGTDGFLTNYVNATGLQGYKYEAADETNIIPLVEPRSVDGGHDTWKHGMTFPVFDRSQAMRNNIEVMQKTRVVAVIMRNDGIGEIYGRDGGMRLRAVVANPQDPNLGSLIQVTIETKDTQGGESKMPLTIDAGDYTSTLALIESMTVPGV